MSKTHQVIFHRGLGFLFGAALMIGVSACESPTSGAVLGLDEVSGPTAQTPVNPSNPPDVSGNTDSSTVVGPSCHTGDSSKYCLALKYVVFQQASGAPVVTQDEAIANVKTINSIYSPCGIAFQIESYLPVNPADAGIRFNIGNYSELDDVRNAYVDDRTLLVATTGTWDRSGSLGGTGANAWTSMPGGGPYGVVLESPVGSFGNIVGHELGHYLNLPHVNDSSDLMNPIIYEGSTTLYSSQCTEMRSAALGYWRAMMR